MPLTLTTPLVRTITQHQILQININLVANSHVITLSDRDIDGNEIRQRVLTMPIFDDLNIVIEPSNWLTENPSGEEMYTLIKHFIYGRLQDYPGDNGIGAGVVS